MIALTVLFFIFAAICFACSFKIIYVKQKAKSEQDELKIMKLYKLYAIFIILYFNIAFFLLAQKYL